MPNSENILFEIKLGSDYKVYPPHVEILVDDEIKYIGNLTAPITDVKFFSKFNFDQSYKLRIIRTGKVNEDSHQIAWLEELKIDSIDIRNVVYTCSYYYPTFPEPWASEQRSLGVELEYPVISGTHWGHDGFWELEFTSPFYKFLLDRIP